MKYSSIHRGYQALHRREKLPRKLKKVIIGTRITRRELRKMLDEVHIISNQGLSIPIQLSDYFCPKCGCHEHRHVRHCVEWPQVWTEDFCARCDSYIGGADNSAYIHVLEEMFYEEEENRKKEAR